MSPVTALTPFCPWHWDEVKEKFNGELMMTATVSAVQLSAKKWAEINTARPCSIDEMQEAVRQGGNCYACFWGAGFIEELKGFVDNPPDWARTKPAAGALEPPPTRRAP